MLGSVITLILNLTNEFYCPYKLYETNLIEQNVRECLKFTHTFLDSKYAKKKASLDLSIWTKSQRFFPICKTETSKVVSPYNQKALLSEHLLQHERF